MNSQYVKYIASKKYKEGYDKANKEWLDRIDEIKAKIEREMPFLRAIDEYDIARGLQLAVRIVDEYMSESEENE